MTTAQRYVLRRDSIEQNEWKNNEMEQLEKEYRDLLHITFEHALVAKNPLIIQAANVQQGKLKIQHVSTTDQLADCLTKPLSKGRHHYLRNKIGVSDGTPTLRGFKFNSARETRVEGDPELLDDSEVKILFLECKQKRRKIVDHRASKSRKIRYRKITTFVFLHPKPNRMRNLSRGASISPYIGHFLFDFYVVGYGSSATIALYSP
ncbi:apoptosis-antagonizing transcription factor, carboxy-terminal domain protein [Medicago truncatula]|uniref:Apoptosis-antagonizing transcription factor, carboxy-terminal domain protein n=1 Tax=Medicago truncatula TaxID=3880 RepID=G7IPZ1_MEDTR|nr:apoptosis-antagonizing transcription factor, carboxy-terminal domain protein [Medicago truncatula]